jgi:hypothetical protein
VKLQTGWGEGDNSAYVSSDKLMVLHQPDKTFVSGLLRVWMQPKMKSRINRRQCADKQSQQRSRR